MPENAKNEEVTSATEIQQDVAQASDAKAEAAGTASDELSEDDLEAVAGGIEPAGYPFLGVSYDLENHDRNDQ